MYSIQSCEKNHKYRIVYSIFLENEGGPGDGSVGPVLRDPQNRPPVPPPLLYAYLCKKYTNTP